MEQPTDNQTPTTKPTPEAIVIQESLDALVSSPDVEKVREELAKTVGAMKTKAQQQFRDGIKGLIDAINTVSIAAEGAIGEISVDEAWHAMLITCQDTIAKHR